MSKASKLEILSFINQNDVISPLDLVEKFGYTGTGAASMLSWLKRQGLVINDRRTEWTLTDRGVSKLSFLRSGGND